MNKKFADIIEESKIFADIDAEVNERIKRLKQELSKQEMIRQTVIKKKQENSVLWELNKKIEEIKSYVDNVSRLYPGYEDDIKELIVEKFGIEKGTSLYSSLMLKGAECEKNEQVYDQAGDRPIPAATYSAVEVVDSVNQEILSTPYKTVKYAGHPHTNAKSPASNYVVSKSCVDKSSITKNTLEDCYKYVISRLRLFLSKSYHLKYDKNTDCISFKFITTKVGLIYGKPSTAENKLSVDLAVQKVFRDEYCFNIDAFIKDCLDGQEPLLDDYIYDGNHLIWYTPNSGLTIRMKAGTLTMRYFKIIYDSKEPDGWGIRFSQTPTTTKWFKPSSGEKYSDNTECLVPYIRFRRKDYQDIQKKTDILSNLPSLHFYKEKDKNYFVGKLGYILDNKIRYYIYYENGVLDKDKNYHTETLSSYMWVLRSDGDILKSYNIGDFVAAIKEYFKNDVTIVDPNIITYQDCVEILEAFNTLEELESVAAELNKMVDQLNKKEKIMFQEYYNTMYAKLSAAHY